MQTKTGVHEKYASQNPISKKLVSNFFSNLSELYKPLDIENIFEGGCGAGFVLNFLNEEKPIRNCSAIDIEVSEIEDAKINIPFCNLAQGSVYDIQFPDNNFDLVICCEVLEHLDNPEQGLKELHRISSKYAILSVPREPIWRMLNMARFKYWDDLGNTPTHLQHWSKKGFIKFVEPYFEIIEVRSPLPWTMIIAKKKELA